MTTNTDRRTEAPPRALTIAWSGRLGLVATASLLAACYIPLNMHSTRRDLSLLEAPARSGRAGARRADRRAMVTKGPLGLDDIVFHLLCRSQRLKVLRLRRKVLAAQHTTGGGLRNPELRIMDISSAIADKGSGGLGLRLRWSPPFPGSLRARRVRSTALARASAQRLGLTVYRLLAQARELHARLTITDRSIAARRRLLGIRRQRREFHRKQVRAGLASLLKADLSRLSELDEKQRLSALATERARLAGRLRRLVELRFGQRISTAARSAASRPTALLDRKTLVRQTLGRHPALAALAEQTRAQHASLWLARTKRYPWIDFVQAAYELGKDKLAHRFQLGIGIRLPLLNWNTDRIQVQRQKLTLLKARREALRRSLSGEVEARHRTVVAAQQAVVRFRKATRPKLRKILARADKAARQQGVDLDEVFRVRAMLVRFELAHLQQLLTYRRARIRLDLATVAPVWRAWGIRLAER